MRRLLTVSIFLLLLAGSFSMTGCGEKTCNDLLQQLVGIQNDIFDLQDQMREARANNDVTAFIKLQQLENNARVKFASVTEEYIKKNCQKRTGEPPRLPAPLPAGETLFE